MKRLVVLMLALAMLLVACVAIDGKSPTSEGEEQVMSGLYMKIGETVFAARLYDTEAAKAFAKKLPLRISMSDLNSNEKYYFFSATFPISSQSVGKIYAGDIMLYGNNCLVLFYETFSTPYSYTRIGSIDDITGLKTAFGGGDVFVEFILP